MATNATKGRKRGDKGRKDAQPGKAEEMAERRAKVWEMRTPPRCMTIRAIADAMGVCPATVCKDLAVVAAEYREEQQDLCDRYMRQQLEEIDAIREVLMPLALGHAEPTEGQPTQAEAIDRLDKLWKRESALLGLDAPKKVESQHTVSHIGLSEWQDTTWEERKRMVAEREASLPVKP